MERDLAFPRKGERKAARAVVTGAGTALAFKIYGIGGLLPDSVWAAIADSLNLAFRRGEQPLEIFELFEHLISFHTRSRRGAEQEEERAARERQEIVKAAIADFKQWISQGCPVVSEAA